MMDDLELLDENEGLPRCESCSKVLLNGSNQAWMQKGDIGDWMSLELICERCANGKHKSYEPLRCQCPQCHCAKPAVTVLCGFLSCTECENEHATVVE